MPNTPFGSLQGKPTFDELVDYVVRLERKLNYVINGGLDSDNIFEAGGWRITPDQLASKDEDVGMSTTDTGGDDVRFWAGGTDKDTAPWRVYKSGKGVATGWKIQSSNGTYPVIILDPDTELFGAYLDANNSLEISPSYGGGAPALFFTVSGNIAATLLANSSNVVLAASAMDLVLSTDVQGNIRISPETGYSVIFPQGFSAINGAGSENLAVSLSNKATAGASTGSAGSHNHGIPSGTQLLDADGVTVHTFVSVGSHSHSQT